MIENTTQLTGDQQHAIETFGELETKVDTTKHSTFGDCWCESEEVDGLFIHKKSN